MGCGASNSNKDRTIVHERPREAESATREESSTNDLSDEDKNDNMDLVTNPSSPIPGTSSTEQTNAKSDDVKPSNTTTDDVKPSNTNSDEVKMSNTKIDDVEPPNTKGYMVTHHNTKTDALESKNPESNPNFEEKQLALMATRLNNITNVNSLQQGTNIDPSVVEMFKYIQQAQAEQEQLWKQMSYTNMTPEDIDRVMAELQTAVNWFVKKKFYSKTENLIVSEELYNYTVILAERVCVFVPVKHADRAKLRVTWKRLVNIFIDSGVIPVIIKLLAGLWDMVYSATAVISMLDGTAELIPQILDFLIVILQNQAYFDRAFALKCCESDLLPNIKAWLTSLLLIFITRTTTVTGEQVILSLLALSHQCAACYPESKPYFDECNFLEVINLYLTNAQDVAKTECLFCLAYIVDEENNELFSSNEDHAKYVVDFLKKTIEDINNTSYTVDMLTKGLSRLAINDNNKKLLFDAGILEPLLQMSTGEDEDDATIATNLIRRLSFHPDIKPYMKKNSPLIKHLKKTASVPKSELTEAAFGCLLNLGEETKIDDINIEMEQVEDEHRREGTEDSYIMISYNRIYRKQVLQIKEALEIAGYKVWFDMEQMQNNTLETMVLAVWEAAIVLICASKSYEESDNCRVEVEQAFKKKKNIIPLMMESYQPSAWLDGIIGLKTFYDFSGKYEFNEKIRDLLRELETKMVQGRNSRSPGRSIQPSTAPTATTATVHPVTTQSQLDVLSWSEAQVKQWVTQLKLKNEKPLAGMDGEQLMFLKSMHEQAPEFYFTYLKSDLQMKSLKDMTAFHIGLKKLG